MDIRIGIVQSGKEIEMELSDEPDRDKMLEEVRSTVAKGDGVLVLVDKRDRRVMVPVEKIAYIEVESTSRERRVGFGAY